MKFELNDKLVNKAVTDSVLNVHYRVPSDWKNVTADKGVVEKLEHSRLDRSLARTILTSGNESTLFSLLDVSHIPASNFQNLTETYVTKLNKEGRWQSIKLDSFRKDNFDVIQVVMTNNQASQFDLIFFNDQRPNFALNYFLPIDSNYLSNTKILESIIASIKPL